MSDDKKQGKKRVEKGSRKEIKEKLLKKKEIDEDKRDVDFEKGDIFAMFLALSYYLIPAFIIIVAAFWLIIWFVFLR